MEYTPDEYTRYYIVQALFKLMNEYRFEEISVSDLARKAGVGRATFYRYFKRKEDVLIYYFDHNVMTFRAEQRYFPRCKEDYAGIISDALTLFRKQKEPFKLIRKARLEHIYLDYLNAQFSRTMKADYTIKHPYAPFLYAGMLFNVSMAWLDDDCRGEVADLTAMMTDAIFPA